MNDDEAMEALRFTEEELAEPITPGGCLVLLTMAASVDRWVTPSMVAAHMWHEILGDTPRGYGMRAGDALAALHEHYATTADQVKPAHLIEIVDGWREQHTQSGADGPMPVGGQLPARSLVSGADLARQAGLAVATPRKAVAQ